MTEPIKPEEAAEALADALPVDPVESRREGLFVLGTLALVLVVSALVIVVRLAGASEGRSGPGEMCAGVVAQIGEPFKVGVAWKAGPLVQSAYWPPYSWSACVPLFYVPGRAEVSWPEAR